MDNHGISPPKHVRSSLLLLLFTISRKKRETVMVLFALIVSISLVPRPCRKN